MMLGWWPTPEMMEEFHRQQDIAVRALTPEQRLWLAAEADHRTTQAAAHIRRNERMYAEMDELLEGDVILYGESRQG